MIIIPPEIAESNCISTLSRFYLRNGEEEREDRVQSGEWREGGGVDVEQGTLG